jgi:hypothetical protein
MFEFFRLWLLVVSAGMVVGGVALVLAAGTPLFSGLNRLIDPAFWSGAPDASTRGFQAWLYSVMGAVMAGWGLSIAILVANAFSSHQAWVWWAVAGGVGLWFPLDTGRSLLHRVYANVIVNTALLIFLAIPLIGTFGEFH